MSGDVIKPTQVKTIDWKEFIDGGFLQEANRQFFHPLGLALAVDDETGYVEVWDYREDPEGFIFGEGVLSADKRDNVRLEVQRHMHYRLKMMRDIIQPIDFVPPSAS